MTKETNSDAEATTSSCTPSEPQDLNDRTLRDNAVAAASGKSPFDLLITGAAIFDAVTHETRHADIGISGKLIASVHGTGLRHDAVDTLDASGCIVTPGLIDSHMHIESSMVTPAAYAESVLPRGVTTIVWDPHELGNVHGLDGVNWAIDACAELALRVIILAPSCVPAAPGFETSGADFGADQMQSMLQHYAIGGVAEVMNMRGVIERKSRMTDVVQAGLASAKPVCGHARGLEGAELAAYMSAGVSSDHELTGASDFMQKLRAGISIELRGSHDHLLPEIVEAINTLGHLPMSVTLCTDDVFPDDLHNRGGLDDVIRRLVAYGMPAKWAIAAATINTAQRLARTDLGLIAAGRRADLAIFNNLQELKARYVICNGHMVASEGKQTTEVAHLNTDLLRASVKCSKFSASDFRIPSNASRVRLATIDKPRFTRHGTTDAVVSDGFIVRPDHATLIAVTHRHGKADAIPRVGYLTDWGTWQGAFCTSVSHDSHNLTVFGTGEDNLAAACNAVVAMQGGMAVVKNGEIIASLALPLSGLLSDAPLPEISKEFVALRNAMDTIVEWQPPYLVFKACFGATLACNAGPHQTDMGIADILSIGPTSTPVLEILAS